MSVYSCTREKCLFYTLIVHESSPLVVKTDFVKIVNEAVYIMDDLLKNGAVKVWEDLQEKEVMRVYQFTKDKLKMPLNLEEFREVWYSEKEDKKGVKFLYNMFMSISQARKSSAGRTFEKTIEKIHSDNGIITLNQKWVDSDGLIYDDKPKKSVHKHDCLIPFGNSNNICDMIVVSKKTSLRERFRQDLDSTTSCKKVIFITRETPSSGAIKSIIGYNCVLVYPHAPLTDSTWSCEEYILRMKHFQQTGRYSLA